jgi:hypothetical protein
MKIARETMLYTSSWGVRMYLRTLRMATVVTVAMTPAPVAAGVTSAAPVAWVRWPPVWVLAVI